jgi:hypothetical protein
MQTMGVRIRGVPTIVNPIIHTKNLLLNRNCLNCDYHRTLQLNNYSVCIFRESNFGHNFPEELTCDKWSNKDQLRYARTL